MTGAPPRAPGNAGLAGRAPTAGVARLSFDTVIPILAGLAILMGVLWRFADLGYPNRFTFDEYHFVENARNYLHGVPDWNDHPPLGKLLMLPGLLLLGDGGWGWRVHAAVLGVVHIAAVGAVAAGLFCSRRAGWLAAAFVAIDGIFVSYSRTALLDVPMDAFMMASLALMLHARRLWWFALAAAALGLAVAVKWIAVCLALVVPLLLRRRGRSVLHALWMAPIAVAVYVGIVAGALFITHRPVTLLGMVQSSLDLLAHHAGFTEWRNPADSRWYTWPFLWKPIVLFRQALADGRFATTSTVGNPVLWYLTTAAFTVTAAESLKGAWEAALTWTRRRAGSAGSLQGPAHAVARGTRDEFTTSPPSSPPATAPPAAAAAVASPMARTWHRLMPPLAQRRLTLIIAVALLLQWMITNRESYIWHYMGTYSLGLGLLAGMSARWSQQQPRAAGGALLALLAVSLFYAPVWMNVPLSETELRMRLIFPLWR